MRFGILPVFVVCGSKPKLNGKRTPPGPVKDSQEALPRTGGHISQYAIERRELPRPPESCPGDWSETGGVAAGE